MNSLLKYKIKEASKCKVALRPTTYLRAYEKAIKQAKSMNEMIARGKGILNKSGIKKMTIIANKRLRQANSIAKLKRMPSITKVINNDIVSFL